MAREECEFAWKPVVGALVHGCGRERQRRHGARCSGGAVDAGANASRAIMNRLVCTTALAHSHVMHYPRRAKSCNTYLLPYKTPLRMIFGCVNVTLEATTVSVIVYNLFHTTDSPRVRLRAVGYIAIRCWNLRCHYNDKNTAVSIKKLWEQY